MNDEIRKDKETVILSSSEPIQININQQLNSPPMHYSHISSVNSDISLRYSAAAFQQTKFTDSFINKNVYICIPAFHSFL